MLYTIKGSYARLHGVIFQKRIYTGLYGVIFQNTGLYRTTQRRIAEKDPVIKYTRRHIPEEKPTPDYTVSYSIRGAYTTLHGVTSQNTRLYQNTWRHISEDEDIP